MASIIKTDKGFRAHVCVNKVRKSMLFNTRREAAAWAAETETNLRNDHKKPEGSKHSLQDAFDRYEKEVAHLHRGVEWEILKLGNFSVQFDSKMKLCDVTPEVIGEWRDRRLKKVSNATVIRELKLLAGVFEEARREWKWIELNPVRDVRKPKSPDHRERIISRFEILAMLRAMKHRKGRCLSVGQAIARAFILALRTGMRAGEICSLKWDCVFDNYCMLPVTKTIPRNVPLSRKAKKVIESMRGWDDVYVFGLGTDSLSSSFRKYRKQAGLDGFTFHDSRHTAATWMARKLKVLDLCKVFGWTSTKHALVYYNPKASDIADILNG